MRILHLSASYKPAYVYGGPIVSVGELCEKLAAYGAGVEVFTTNANGAGNLDVPTGLPQSVGGVTVTYFKRITGDPTHFSPGLLLKVWQRSPEFDAIHVHAWWNTVSVLGALVAVVRNKKVILSPRGNLSNYSFNNRSAFTKKMIHSFIGKWLLKRMFIHVTSENEQEQVLKYTSSKKMISIPNLVKMSTQPVEPRSDPPTFRLLFFSRIDEKKGLDILLEALPKAGFPYTLSIAGNGRSGYIQQLTAKAKDLGVQHINWLGRVGDEEKFNFFGEYDLLVLPSRNENFANVVIESLSAGLPVLVSSEVGLSDYIASSGLGWVCEPDSVSLIKTMEEAFKDREKRQKIRLSAPGNVRRDFDETRILMRYLQLYEHQINERI